MVRQFLLATLVFAMAATGVAIAQDEADPNRLALEGVAAVVNDKPISYSDVRQRARLLLLSVGGEQPTPEQVQQITGQALEQLIDESLQLQKASEFDMEIEAREIDGAVEDMARQGGTTGDVLKAQLLDAGVNPASLEEQMRAEIAWNRVMSGLYGSRIRVSENQVDDQLERMRSASQKTQYRVSEIFLFAPDEETRVQALTAANTVAEQLRQGADFRVAAQRLSSAPTAATGGDMGWISTDDLAPELAAAVSGAAQPGLLDPVEVENGVYILLVANKREPSEAVTKVNLKRLVATDGSEADLKAAVDSIKTCDDVSSVANSKTNLRSNDLDEINIEELGPEGKALILAVEVGQPTEIFAASGGLAVMYVCAREDGAEALPSRDDLKGSLRSRELSMISERELRNLRREATIIYR
ncbi:peptidylprolyl isomerase [Hyphomonas johnsonii]|uniref:Parvulin-like PPIase n=1 Tax=Hyphomonas johnsonii MHS-2 TaxID=1280950 RepID=A0A059FTL1_9PROT|nr:peptidylprolyl isomerase [Hyphomonas johnsonii]KCZ94005.1 peptidyl-prolyl cis-trans isomerase domain-containing protein [Hyphomonas johnsonii MHS-2]